MNASQSTEKPVELQAAPKTPTSRVDAIDVLRGLSCLAVVLYHVRVDLWIGWWRIRSYPEQYSAFDHAVSWLSVPCPFLGYAIVLFFIISGFCIHYPNAGKQAMPWPRYLARRFLRIYPPYLTAILFTAFVALACSHWWNDKTWDFERIVRVATLTQNYPPEAGQFLSNPSLWTIPVEMEFYLFYPLVFLAWRRFGATIVGIAALALAAIALFLAELGFAWITFTSALFWLFWLAGAWFADRHRKKDWPRPGPAHYVGSAVLLAMGLWARMEGVPSAMQYFLWGSFYVVVFLLIVGRKTNDDAPRLLRLASSALAWIGSISFSLYLIHFPFFKLCGFLYRDAFGHKPANFLVTLSFVPLAILVAWLFHRVIETPSHHLSRRVGRSKTRT